MAPGPVIWRTSVEITKEFHMTLYRHRSIRVLAGVFCAIGIFGIVDGTAESWTLLTLVALISAVLTGSSVMLAKVQPHVRVNR